MRGTGEDWAEKIVSELARLLGIPHVEYELAHEYEGQRAIQPGVICPTFVPRPQILVLGKLAEISQSVMDAILAEIPPQRMSPVTREFTLELLMINQRRLLESLQP